MHFRWLKLKFGWLKLKWLRWLSIGALLTGCMTIGGHEFEQRFGEAQPRERIVESLLLNNVDYWADVKPIIDRRCVVCHGCYDAPCQLKMSAIEGITRGASPQRVYDSSRLKSAPLTRLFEDATSVAEWRDKGFHPVLNEYPASPKANREASVMYRMLELKGKNPLPDAKQLPASFDLGLNRKEECTEVEQFDDFATKHPLWGMPYALPGLASDEQETLMNWVEQGAVYTARPASPAALVPQVQRWETFLNEPSLKQQLSSRYIYEHLSYAHLYFPEVAHTRFFTLVRSSTPPGEPIKIIATRRPYDDPGVEPFYYRIQAFVGTIVDKTHMPYALNARRMKDWQDWFVHADFAVTTLPSYDLAIASNPFRAFAELPITSRHKFLLDEAQFTIMAYIKGPVCRGGVALDVIADDFWVVFSDPDRPNQLKLEEFLTSNAESLTLPAATGDTLSPIRKYHQYAKQQTAFLAKKDQYLAEMTGPAGSATIEIEGIWDGNGVNQNAALTIYRHYDNATVEQGLLGAPPRTAWLIDYSLLERIHYLLVAGYDVYGNLGHQLDTRLYMDFLRMEGEANFLAMLPPATRTKERDYWYRGAKENVKAYVSSPTFDNRSIPNIEYKTDDPKQELYDMLRQRLAAVLPTKHDMAAVADADIRNPLIRLNQLVGKPATLLPENAMLQVNTATGPEYFTVLRNSAHSSMSAVFKEDKNRLPDEDTVTILPGFIGAYPNAFFVVKSSEINDFVDALSGLQTEADYAAVLDSYGIRRTNSQFWSYSDAFHEGYKALSPQSYGVLDYNRLENR
jgi:hypothetical protein